ncbi:hypothetical protein JOE68_005174 [Saccharothrix algeriensis]|uniref:Uncharacterized protein n=1 Tax=Saccharothrix algeriensis TaxID=173560 RepID=A0ABS2SEC4_9PSEU|nr:hypothetical protein [Saccharothrix algeriensis]
MLVRVNSVGSRVRWSEKARTAAGRPPTGGKDVDGMWCGVVLARRGPGSRAPLAARTGGAR